mmetsp:Transcript_32909/g.59358  ORF Transcript_32909/g.59358 Transcript_32909/m.59358 type:complete len:217 (+) Transcript_32909:281-931(+)
MLSVILLKNLLLLIIHKFQSLAHKPRTFRIFDIRANLPQHFRRRKCIQDVILNLEIFPKNHADIFGLFVECLALLAIGVVPTVRQCQCAGEVKAVITSFVSDASLVPIEGKPRQIQGSPRPLRIGRPVRINMLSHLGLECRINKKMQNLHIRWVRFEMSPQRLIDHILKDQRVVDGIVLCDVGTLVPARRATASDTRVHNVIGHEEECLEPLHLPP